MEKEIIYRVVRIVIVSVFLVFFSFLRQDVKERYDEANSLMEKMPGFVVTEVDSNVSNNNGLKEKHRVRIKNVSGKKQNVSFVIKNVNDSFPYDYLNYSVLKNGKIISKGLVTSDDVFYTEKISIRENSIYEIIFSIDLETIYELGGVSMSGVLEFI